MSGRVMFRCDASPSVGGGHVMRCFALAEAFGASGHEVIFAMSEESIGFLPTGFSPTWQVAVMSGDANVEPDEMAAVLGSSGHLIVIDHYRRDAAFERSCRPLARHLLAWDDQPNRSHDCDLLLDVGGEEAEADYEPFVPKNCRLLLGTRFAPLRSEFTGLRPDALARRDGRPAARIFVSFGATDPAGATLAALDAIHAAGPGVAVDVAIGSHAPHLAVLRQRCNEKVALHVDASNVADLMMNADLAIGACGSTSWERCCLGLPTIVVTIADNQRLVAMTLARAGAACDLGPFNRGTSGLIADTLVAMTNDTQRRIGMAKAAAALVDGCGARRVVDAVEELAA